MRKNATSNSLRATSCRTTVEYKQEVEWEVETGRRFSPIQVKTFIYRMRSE